MKTEARVMNVTSTLEGERVAMAVHKDAMQHIMSILTDLYSDQELAVIREYSTNAFDAHVESGVSRPIEVTTPSALSPFFRVRDYGVGLDAEDIREIYSQYGASTKRNSNEVVGMLGLGCKSALTYTDQFTLSSTKDGVCTQVSISRDADGSGSMTIVDTYESDEPSGVEIIVPTKGHNLFERKARDFFRFWKKGTVLLDGKEPNRVDGMWLSDDILMTKDLDRDYVVMGNVAYPSPHSTYGRWNTVYFVNIGDVNFTPSREALMMTAKTKETLEAFKDRLSTEKEAALQRLIDEASTRQDAVRVALDAADLGLGRTNNYGNKSNYVLTYKNQVIPETVEAQKDKPFLCVEAQKRYKSKGYEFQPKLYMHSWKDSMFLTGFDEGGFSPYKKQKLDQWLAEKNLSSPRLFVLVDKVPAELNGWIDSKMIHPWAEVKAQKIVRANTPRRDGRPSGSYEGRVDGVWNRSILAETIDATKPLYYINRTVENESGFDVLEKIHNNNLTILFIPANRVAKFQRDFPMAKGMRQAVRNLAADWVKNLTKGDKALIGLSQDPEAKEILKSLDASEIDDPAVKTAIGQAKTNASSLINKHNLYYRWIDGNLNFTFQNPLDSYPLLTATRVYGRMNDKVKTDLYIYLNAAYAARTEA